MTTTTNTNTGEGDMFERVARALIAHEGFDPDSLINGEPVWHNARGWARAAIEAMREPTEAMEMAGFLANRFENPRPCGSTCIGRITIPAGKPWSAMIEAALHSEQSS